MKSYKTKYIILICISIAVTLASLAALLILLLAVKGNNGIANGILLIMIIIGLTMLLSSSILFVTKNQFVKRSNLVLERYKNLGNIIYVQGVCGNTAQDKKDGANNAASFAGMLAFAALFGVGVGRASSSRKKTEFFISESDIYENEMYQSAFVGYKYNSVEAMKPIYKEPFIIHTLTKKKRQIILTGVNGQDYIVFDLNTCSTSGEILFAALKNVLGNTEEINKEL